MLFHFGRGRLRVHFLRVAQQRRSASESSTTTTIILKNSSFQEPGQQRGVPSNEVENASTTRLSPPSFLGNGVLRSDKTEDIRLMMLNYTTPALAAAVRDREDVLQLAAHLLAEGRVAELEEVLSPHEARFVKRRRKRVVDMDLSKDGFRTSHITMIRKYLVRMPRQVTIPHRQRASIILPLCNVSGVPSVLFEKRSQSLRAHPGEVCFPGEFSGGMSRA